jgi:excisionase family DNA binding protein
MRTIQLQVAITLDEIAIRTLLDVLRPPMRQQKTDEEKKREARLLASRNTPFAGEKPAEDQGLLIDSREAARLLNVSPRTLYQMYTDGTMPPPIRIGRAIRFSLDALKKWVEAGCPARK